MISVSDISLLPFNTFGIDASAKLVLKCFNDADVCEAIRQSSGRPMLVLGGGSNVLFMEDFEGVVIFPMIESFEVLNETEECVEVRVGAGVEWDSFVAKCVANGWQGVENLSAIPGNVGASPVQNIGAYGAEAADVILRVEGFDAEANPFSIAAADCEFGYRTSIFKQQMKGKAVITHVVFGLRKTTIAPKLDYGPVCQAVEALGKPTIANVRKAIIDIRNAKLPDPKVEGNAGSFFKNPEVPTPAAEALQKRFPDMPCYALENDMTKIPAGWLIDRCGWKGQTLGKVGVHSKQALVLVNKGGATGKDVMNLAYAIRSDVEKQFGITIEPEVNRIWKDKY